MQPLNNHVIYLSAFTCIKSQSSLYLNLILATTWRVKNLATLLPFNQLLEDVSCVNVLVLLYRCLFILMCCWYSFINLDILSK